MFATTLPRSIVRTELVLPLGGGLQSHGWDACNVRVGGAYAGGGDVPNRGCGGGALSDFAGDCGAFPDYSVACQRFGTHGGGEDSQTKQFSWPAQTAFLGQRLLRNCLAEQPPHGICPSGAPQLMLPKHLPTHLTKTQGGILGSPLFPPGALQLGEAAGPEADDAVEPRHDSLDLLNLANLHGQECGRMSMTARAPTVYPKLARPPSEAQPTL